MQRATPLITALLFLALCPIAAQASQITRHDKQVVAFFQHHPRLARTPAGGAALAAVLPRVIRALADARPVYPPDHRLWQCIGWYESGDNPHSPGNGVHAGLLGMSYGWEGQFSGDPAYLSDAQQEWAAHRAWAASGYSYAFLYGNWYEWDPAGPQCGTTG